MTLHVQQNLPTGIVILHRGKLQIEEVEEGEGGGGGGGGGEKGEGNVFLSLIGTLTFGVFRFRDTVGGNDNSLLHGKQTSKGIFSRKCCLSVSTIFALEFCCFKKGKSRSKY